MKTKKGNKNSDRPDGSDNQQTNPTTSSFRLQEKNFHQLLEKIQAVYVCISISPKEFVYIGQNAYKTIGLSKRKVLSSPEYFFESIHKDDIPAFEQCWEECIEDNIASNITFRIFDARKSIRFLEFTPNGVYDDQGNLIAIEGLLKNITEEEQYFAKQNKLLQDKTDEIETAHIRHRQKSDLLLNFHYLFDVLPVSIFVLDNADTILYLNKSATDLIQLQQENAKDSKISEHSQIDSELAKLFSDNKKCIKNNEYVTISEYQIEKNANASRWYTIHKIPITYPKSNHDALLYVMINITRRKQYEEQLKENRKRISLATDAGKIVIWEYELASNVFTVTSGQSVLLGYNPATLNTLEKLQSIAYPEDRELLETQILNIISNKQDVLDVDFRLLHTNGSFRWMHHKGTVLYNKKNKPVKIVGTSVDITERKKHEALKDALYKISEAANIASDLNDLYYLVHTIISELLPAENFYIALYHEKEEMISFPYYVDVIEFGEKPQNLPPEKLEKSLTQYLIAKGKPLLVTASQCDDLVEQGILDMIGANSTEWLGVPLKTSEGKIIGALAVQTYEKNKFYTEEDKSILAFVSSQVAMAIERKLQEEQLRKYSEELQESNASKDKFFSIIAHDLKSPFTALIGFTDLLLDEIYDLDTDEIVSYLTRINKSSRKIYNLLENLLTWARHQSGRLEYNPEKHNLWEIVDQTKSLNRATALSKSIKITNSVSKNIFVFADLNMLDTTIRNLISNAIKFTPQGGAIAISAKKTGSKIAVSVKDSGVGIAKKFIDVIFNKETNRTTIGTSEEKGTGLGLLICSEFVHKNGGEISVQSELGKGSTFTFTVPIASAPKKN